jgi:hypothetical protein
VASRAPAGVHAISTTPSMRAEEHGGRPVAAATASPGRTLYAEHGKDDRAEGAGPTTSHGCGRPRQRQMANEATVLTMASPDEASVSTAIR